MLVRYHNKDIKGAESRLFYKIFRPRKKLPFNWEKPGKSSLLGYKSTKEIIINHKETRMVKDGEKKHALQTTNLKNLG